MPAVYSSQPISGFTGHIPGSKWQVGSRYIPPIKEAHPTSVSYVVEHSNSSKEEVTEDNSSQSSETIQPIVQNGAVERSLDKQRDAAHHTAKEYHNPQKGNRSQGVHFVQERSHNRFTEQETFYSQGLGNHSSDFSLLHSGDSDISMEFRTQGSSHSEESWQVKGQQREQSMKQRAHSLPRSL